MQHMAFIQPSPASIRELLGDLDAAGVGVGVDGVSILDDFSAAAEPLLELLRSVSGPSLTSDSLTLAICHMLARATTDLLAGVHLISHLYLPQAYTVLRPVYEAIDLVELFAKDPQQADLWVSTDKTFREFTPSAVRKKLGVARSTAVRDHFTEHGTHPRLPGARLSGAVTEGPSQTDSNLYLAVGPFAPSSGAIVAAYVNALVALGSLSARARHLDVATASVDVPPWLAKHIDVIRRVTHALRTLETQLLTGGTVLSTQYADYLASLEQMRASIAPPAASTAQET